MCPTITRFASLRNITRAFFVAGPSCALRGLVAALRKLVLPPASTRAKSSSSANSSSTSRARGCRYWLSTHQMVSTPTSHLKSIPTLFLHRMESREFCFFDPTVYNRTNFRASSPSNQTTIQWHATDPGQSIVPRVLSGRDIKSKTMNCVFEHRQVKVRSG